MSEIDWSKAPEGASHFCNGDWFKKEDGKWCYWFDGARSWTETAYADPSNFSWWGARIARPTTPQWSGEGLPPVGAVCEYRDGLGGWFDVEITAIARLGVCFVQRGRGGENYVSLSAHFRPTRTPEQIADTERYEAVMRMSDIVGDIEKVPSWTDALEALYDAGLRFPS